MPIENRELPTGTRLAVRHKGTVHTCEVVKTKDGLRYRLENGQEFNSPSSAGREITDGVAVNGWRFWSLEGDLKERKAKAARKAKGEPKARQAPAKRAAKAKGKKAAKKKSARAATKRDSYGCGACGETFPTQKKAVAHALTHTSA
jgi:hypothetical protein